jgi:hypothetical protein
MKLDKIFKEMYSDTNTGSKNHFTQYGVITSKVSKKQTIGIEAVNLKRGVEIYGKTSKQALKKHGSSFFFVFRYE